MKIRALLVFVIISQLAVLAAVWSGPSLVSRAEAQIPDAGLQRGQILDELRALNGKMDKLIGILQGGQLQVRVATPDEKKAR